MDDLYFGDASSGKRLYCAHATVTAPVIYTTAAGTGGPLLWNGSSTVQARIVAVGFAVSVASAVAAALGITGNVGQVTAPSSTTAIESSGNLFLGGVKSSCSVFRLGTVTNAGNLFFPIGQITTGALTVTESSMNWQFLNRIITVPPGGWVSLAGSATLTTAVIQCGLIWEEVPLPL